MFQTLEITHVKTLKEDLENEMHSVWPEYIMGGCRGIQK